MNSSKLTTCFESLVFPEEELEKDDVLQCIGSMVKNLWSIFGFERMATGMVLQPYAEKSYPKTGLTTSKEFTTQQNFKIKHKSLNTRSIY